MHWWQHLASVGREYWPLRNPIIRSILCSSVRAVVPCSTALKTFLEVNGVPCTAVIPHPAPPVAPIDPSRIDAFRTKHTIDGPAMIFGGRLSGDKGLTAFLDAAERVLHRVPSARFVIVGDSNRFASLEHRPRQLQEAVRLTGWLPVDEFAVAVAACDALTVPSLYLDALPTMTLWAMALGKPVVGTCFGGTPELIEDGRTGFVAHPGHPEEYAEKMIMVLQDSAGARDMGTEAKRWVEQTHALPTIAGKYLELLGA